MVELALVQAQDARAIILAEQTERDARTAGDHVTEAAARILEARALLLRGDFRGCAGHLEAARRVIDKFHVTAGIPLTWRIARANLSLALGRLDDAAHQLAERDDPGDPSVDRSYNYRLARLQLLIEQTHYDEAQRLASDTLALLRGGGDQSARIMVTALLSDAYGDRGQLAEAERAARSARSLLTDRTAPLPRKAALASAARWGAAEPILTAAFR
jgi:tetratricopeptide (TPR) repeat protein